MPVTLRIVLDQRQHRQLQDGTFPVVLRVRKGQYRDYPVQYGNMAVRMTPDDWEKTRQERPREPWATWKRRFAAIEQAARDVVQSMPTFTHDGFRELWVDRSDREDVFSWLQKHVLKQSKPSTRHVYERALESLKTFHGRSRLTFPELTKAFLDRYRAHLGKQSTVATYFAPLRAACNTAERSGAIRREQNPFRNYQIPTTDSRKDAVFTLEEIRIMATAPAPVKSQEWARDMFLLSYLLSGMPPVDLFSLTWAQINRERGVLTYLRQKTRDSKKNTTTTVVVINPKAWEIIEQWAVRIGSERLFPYRPYLSRRSDTPTAMLQSVNSNMRAFLPAVGLKYRSMYSARHSAITHLSDYGLPAAIVASSAATSEAQLSKTYRGQAAEVVARKVSEALGW